MKDDPFQNNELSYGIIIVVCDHHLNVVAGACFNNFISINCWITRK